MIIDSKKDLETFDWISTIENIPIESLCLIENKSPINIISDSDSKAKVIKMMSEMVRLGHFLDIDFPENFINHNLKKASINDTVGNNKIDKLINILDFMIKVADEKKIRFNQNKEILLILKNMHG